MDRLDGELTASVDGVLLAAEDVELMSTALMYFAKALQDGADYAVCNAVFGFGGATALYQSQPLQAQNRCAVVSRTLLEHCRAAAHDPENVPELLALAAQLCTKPTLIPQALLHYERGICAEDAFSAHGKRAFIMSHVLDMTGAPIVLVSAVPVLRSMGYEVLVLGPSDGGSLHLFLDAGASVITRSSCRNVSDAWGMALCADFVIASTVVTYEVVISAHNPDLKLKPRLTANITIYILDKKDVLSVPNKALRFTPEEPLIGKNDIVKDCESEHKVWTREGTTFTAHPVEIGITNGISTEIISGVTEGTRVVTEATIGGIPGESMEAPTGQEGGERSPFMPGPPGSKKKK